MIVQAGSDEFEIQDDDEQEESNFRDDDDEGPSIRGDGPQIMHVKNTGEALKERKSTNPPSQGDKTPKNLHNVALNKRKK